MPGVTSQHKQYIQMLPLWSRVRDCEEGEDTIKLRATLYLPRLSGQSHEDYKRFLDRADYYNGTGRTIDGLHGAIFRQPPVIQWRKQPTGAEQFDPATEDAPKTFSGSSLEQTQEERWEENITLSGVPLQTFIKKTLREILITGRYGILVDMPQDGDQQCYLCGYNAESIINWREVKTGGVTKLTLVVLEETQETIDADGFGVTESIIYRVLDLDESGFYRVRIFVYNEGDKEWVLSSQFAPTRLNQRLDFIPFLFDGVTDLTPAAEIPPLLDLANTNLTHYRTAADYQNALHFTSLPQPWVSTTDRQHVLAIGGTTAWLLNPGDQAGYLEFSGHGIGAIKDSLTSGENQMARLGAELLEHAKEGVEAAETVRLRQSGRASVLSNIANTSSLAFTKALKWLVWWSNYDETDVQVKINDEFIEQRLSPQDLIALTNSWMMRAVSRDTLLYNIKRGGVMPEDRTIADEKALIDAETVTPTSPALPLDQQPLGQPGQPPPRPLSVGVRGNISGVDAFGQ